MKNKQFKKFPLIGLIICALSCSMSSKKEIESLKRPLPTEFLHYSIYDYNNPDESSGLIIENKILYLNLSQYPMIYIKKGEDSVIEQNEFIRPNPFVKINGILKDTSRVDIKSGYSLRKINNFTEFDSVKLYVPNYFSMVINLHKNTINVDGSKRKFAPEIIQCFKYFIGITDSLNSFSCIYTCQDCETGFKVLKNTDTLYLFSGANCIKYSFVYGCGRKVPVRMQKIWNFLDYFRLRDIPNLKYLPNIYKDLNIKSD